MTPVVSIGSHTIPAIPSEEGRKIMVLTSPFLTAQLLFLVFTHIIQSCSSSSFLLSPVKLTTTVQRSPRPHALSNWPIE